MRLQSQQAHVVFRGSREEAERFLGLIRPALLALTGHTGIVCREERGKIDPEFEVRAMCEPRVAAAIHALRRLERLTTIAERMVVKFLEEHA